MNLERINQVLQAYTGQEDSMQEVASVLKEELGENWTETVFQDLSTLSPALKENLTHAFNYYAATMAWNETQEYLSQKKFVASPEIKDRLPILKHWLDFFGAPGVTAYNQLAEKVAAAEGQNQSLEEREDVAANSQREQDEIDDEALAALTEIDDITQDVAGLKKNAEENPVTEPAEAHTEEAEENNGATVAAAPVSKEAPPEVFEIQKVERQIELLNQNQAWLAARCIQLKNIEIYAYPFYGFVVDLLRQTLKSIEALEANPDIDPLLDQYMEGGRQALENKKQAIQHEIELAEQNCESATTTLISEDVDMDEIRKTLGFIDSSNTVEYIGPAPDGFELLDDEAPLDEGAIKEQYHKIENMDALTGEVKSPAEAQEELKEDETEKKTSQKAQKGVQRKLSFSLKPKKPTESAT